MVVNCEDVWREVSNYLDGDVDPSLRQAVEEHIRGCKHCTAVLDGTRNVVRLYGDERFVELPAGFSQRLKLKLESQAGGGRLGPGIGWSAWALAAAAAIILAGGLWISRAANPSLPQQSALAKPGINIPPELLVAVSGNSRVFHLPECGLIHGKKDLKTMKAGEAIHKGLVPCVECLHQYLSRMQRRTRQLRSVDLSGLDRSELQKELPNSEAEEPRAAAVRE
jgi:hypothetical protein